MEGSNPLRPDARKSLAVLQQEWSSCQACDLGQMRDAIEGSFVFGEGTPHGVMFIGEGPGRDEETEGSPFVGRSGDFLRSTISVLGFKRYYLTNVVCCRSWQYVFNPDGSPRLEYRSKLQQRKDAPPNQLQIDACRARLMEQIYLVDPILIVALGARAAEALLRTPVTLQKDSGLLKTVEVPGATFRPSLTTVGHKWARWVGPKDNRQLIQPYEPNAVTYPLIALYHPTHVMDHAKDRRPGSPRHLFATGMKKVYDMYSRYLQEVSGENIVENLITEDDIYEAQDAGSDSD